MPSDIYSLIMGSDPDAQESAAAMANAIRNNRAAQIMGAMGQPNAGPQVGAAAGGMAKQDQELLHKSIIERQRYGEDTQTRMLNTKLGVANIAAQARLAAAQEAANARMYGSDNTLAGMLARVAAMNSGSGDKATEKKMKDWYSFYDKYNQHLSSSRTSLGMNGRTIKAADRLEALIDSQKALDPNEVRELGMGMASMLTAGGAGATALRTIHELTPQSIKMDIASAVQYLTAKPQDAGAQEFAKRFVRTLQRERSRANERSHEIVRQGALSRRDLVRDPAVRPTAEAAFKASGMSPEMISNIFNDSPYTPGGGGEVSPEDLEAKAWAEAHPNDPRAAAIMGKLKAKGL